MSAPTTSKDLNKVTSGIMQRPNLQFMTFYREQTFTEVQGMENVPSERHLHRRKKDYKERRQESGTQRPEISGGEESEEELEQPLNTPVPMMVHRSMREVVKDEMLERFTQKEDRSADRFPSVERERKRRELEAQRGTPAGTIQRGSLLSEVHFSEEMRGLYSVTYSPRGDVVACGFGNGTIEVRTSTTADLKHTVRLAIHNTLPIMWSRFHHKQPDLFFSASACGNIFISSVSQGYCTEYTQEHENEVNALDVNVDATHLMSAGRDTKVRIYDISTKKIVQTYQQTATMASVDLAQRPLHSRRVFAVRAHDRNNSLFLTGGWDNNVKVWDMRSSKTCVSTVFGPHICGDALDVKNDIIVTGSWTMDNSLQVWDLRNCKLIQNVNPTNRQKTRHGEFLYIAKYFDGDPTYDTVLLAGSGLRHVEVVSIKQNEVLGSWIADDTVHAVDSNQSFIMFGGALPILTVCRYM